jgi:hypothetical protein
MAMLYANENYPLPVVKEPRRMGHDVVTTQDLAMAGLSIPDDQVLQTAINMGRAVLTHNRLDFIRLHRLRTDHFGIVVCTLDNNFPALASRIHDKLAEAGAIDGQLIRINRPRV